MKEFNEEDIKIIEHLADEHNAEGARAEIAGLHPADIADFTTAMDCTSST